MPDDNRLDHPEFEKEGSTAVAATAEPPGLSLSPGPDDGPTVVPLRRDPEFRRYWLARLVSLAGSSVTLVVLPVLVYQLTASNFWTSCVVVAEGLPYLCLGLLAGAAGDRYDRKKIMIGADLASAAVLASIPIAYAADALSMAHVIAAAFCVHSLFVFFDAANWGILPVLAGEARLATARSALAASNNLADLGGPIAAGAALAVVPGPSLLVADALSFIASALLIRGIRRHLLLPPRDSATAPSARPGLRADIVEGLTFLWRQVLVRIQTIIWSLQLFCGAFFVGQLVPWADEALAIHPGDPRLGWLYGVWGVGGLVAAAVFPRLSRRFGEVRIILVFLPLAGLGAIVTGLTANWLVAIAAIGSWAVVYVVALLAVMTSRQRMTPDHLQSRISTTGRMLSFGLGWPLGALTGGLLAELIGPGPAIASAGTLLALVGAGTWLSPLRSAAGSSPSTVAQP